MEFKLNALTVDEQSAIEAAHDRILNLIWKKYADSFPTDAHFFLHECHAFLENVTITDFQEAQEAHKQTVKNLLMAIGKPRMKGVEPSLLWEVLEKTRSKWDPFQGGDEFKKISEDSRLFAFLFTVLWRMRNRTAFADGEYESLDDLSETLTEPNDAFDNIELDLAIFQAARGLKPERRTEVIAVLQAWLFDDIAREALGEALGWDEKRVARVWKTIQKKFIREKIAHA